MPQEALTFPELMLIGSTRGMLGAGLAFLLSNKLSADTRRGAGWALFAVGVVTSIPLGIILVRKSRSIKQQAA